jgi:hypothetical protein
MNSANCSTFPLAIFSIPSLSSPSRRGRDVDPESFHLDFFGDDIRTLFLPDLATRLMQGIRKQDALLLMVNYSPRLTPVVMDLLSIVRVRVVTFRTTFDANLPSSRSRLVWSLQKTRTRLTAIREWC